MLAVELGGAGPAGDPPPVPLTPIQRLQESISGTRFVQLGTQWVSYFVEVCGLQPQEHVLDVGSGRGRVAAPLTDYLTTGTYEGFDIDRERVDWCTRNITSRYPNFSFQAADIFSPAYNPNGSKPADKYEFPFSSGVFDFVFVVTVFNTMLPAEVENYLRESVRVLKEGGRLLATFLLLNDESLRLLSEKYDELPPEIQNLHDGDDHGDHRVAKGQGPYAGVTYQEQFVLDLFDRVGLRVRTPLHYGWWPGRKAAVAHDFIVADRARRD